MSIPEVFKKAIKTPLRPTVRWFKREFYSWNFERCFHRLEQSDVIPRTRILKCHGIAARENSQGVWTKLKPLLPTGVTPVEISFSENTSELDWSGKKYWEKYSGSYQNVGQGREKALEHSLTFELFRMKDVKRYCDVASSASPIQQTFVIQYPQIEFWRQDLGFETDFAKKTIGGLAQEMKAIPDGFFDAMALHCSFEHFSADGDGKFVKEVDRVLSERGACLIIPLYLGEEHRIYFDPTLVSPKSLTYYDPEAKLCPTFDYRQEHGRHYEPETLVKRVLAQIPKNLEGTVIRFKDQNAVSPSVYLNFALVLHRKQSVFRLNSE